LRKHYQVTLIRVESKRFEGCRSSEKTRARKLQSMALEQERSAWVVGGGETELH